jgi:hypothetical protein
MLVAECLVTFRESLVCSSCYVRYLFEMKDQHNTDK